MNKSTEPRIAIIGAGPSGLLTAHYLAERGYRNVMLLERSGRVGGMCFTLTHDSKAFDLGANYITPAYSEIRKLAKKVGASLYSERPFIAMSIEDDGSKVETQSMFAAIRHYKDGSPISLWTLLVAMVRYVFIRFGLRRTIDAPTFASVAADHDLSEPIAVWLEKKQLDALYRIFVLPVTLMGYGDMESTPAVYPLKFMTLKTFIPMTLKETPLIGRLIRWPKRFTDGYQRFFEKLSWSLNVRTNINITSVSRDGEGVHVDFEQLEQDENQTMEAAGRLTFDKLILACPLSDDNRGFLDYKEDEHRLLHQITYSSYCMSTFHVSDFSRLDGINTPLAAAYPVPPVDSLLPYGIAKQWPDNDYVQVYSRTPNLTHDDDEALREEVTGKALKVIEAMGGEVISGESGLRSFERWPYFQHVRSEAIRDNWYGDLERQQGRHDTYYVGGATNFELIEPIAEYAKNLAAEHFPKQFQPRKPLLERIREWFRHLSPRTQGRLKATAAVLAAAVLVYIFFMPLKSVPIEKPIAGSTPEAAAASQLFWDTIHADDAQAIPHLLDELYKAYELDSNDATLTAILGGVHLWRFHLRDRLKTNFEEQRRDLELAVRFGKESVAIDPSPDSASPSLTSAAQWQLAVLTGNTEEIDRIQLNSLENSIVYPAFAGFVQGWMFAAMIDQDSPDYDQALVGYHFMMSQCAGFSISDNLVFNKLIHTFYGIKSIFSPVCYNNQLAPHSIEGTFIGYGDAFLKQGNIEKARLWYENTKTSPTYSTWKYQGYLEYRLENLEELSKKFQDDSGKVDVSGYAMNFQSAIGCGSCHTR